MVPFSSEREPVSNHVESYYLGNDPYSGYLLFMQDKHVKLYWIAFFALWIYWALFWLSRHAFGDGQTCTQPTPVDGEQLVPPTEPEQPTKPLAWNNRPEVVSVYSRLDRISILLRDLLLLLLSVLILNTLGCGGQRSVMIISWTYFGLAAFWSIVEMLYENYFVRLVYTIMFFSLDVAIAVIAFSYGFQQSQTNS